MLPPGVLDDLQANEIKLAALPVPSGLNFSMKAAITVSIREAFVFGFRVVMLICAALSLGSAVVAWWFIPKDRDHPKLHATASPDGEGPRKM
jgi:hypothetical protein